jgi:signal transduction histidine kinase
MRNLFKKLFGSPGYPQNGYNANDNGEYKNLLNDKSACSNYIKWDVLNEKLELSKEALLLLELPWDSMMTYDDIQEIAYPEDLEHIRSIISSIFVKKFFPDFYCRIITHKNNVKHIYVTGEVVLTPDGSISHIIGNLQDVTEQGIYIQKIQQQNKRLQDIAWIQSHKMRSPVATIMGLIQLFNCDDPNDPVNMKVLEGVKEAANHLDQAIKEINDKTEPMKFAS